MNNPKTSIAGILMILGAIAYAGAHCWQAAHGVPGAVCMGAPDIAALTSAIGGIGLIAAKDGGH